MPQLILSSQNAQRQENVFLIMAITAEKSSTCHTIIHIAIMFLIKLHSLSILTPKNALNTSCFIDSLINVARLTY